MRGPMTIPGDRHARPPPIPQPGRPAYLAYYLQFQCRKDIRDHGPATSPVSRAPFPSGFYDSIVLAADDGDQSSGRLFREAAR